MSSHHFLSTRKQFENAQKSISTCTTESQVFATLLSTKPEFLNFNQFPWIDKTGLEKEVKEWHDKLVISGYPDRGERLKYLASVLRKQWAKKPELYKSIVCFMFEYCEGPFSDFEDPDPVSSKIYSEEIEGDSEEDEEEIDDGLDEEEVAKAAQEFKELMVQELKSEILEPIHFSEDEELSDWSGDDDSSESDKDDETYLNLSVGRKGRSATIPDFQSHPDFLPFDPSILQKSHQLYWSKIEKNARDILNHSIRQVVPVALECGPVISNIYVFYSRFGEFWEWKKHSQESQQLNLHLILENDIIRELLWQFTSPNPSASIIFEKQNFTFKSSLMIKSLSKSRLDSLMEEFSQALRELYEMKTFISSNCPSGTSSKILRGYTLGLGKILDSVVLWKMSEIQSLMVNRSDSTAPRTLLKLRNRLNETIQIISTFHSIHSKLTSSSSACSLQLFTKLESILTQTVFPTPKIYGLVVYLYMQMLQGLISGVLIEPLEFIESSLEFQTNEFTESIFVFAQRGTISINDSEFWESCVKLNVGMNMEEQFGNESPWILEIIPKVLNLLKILGMFKELDHTHTQNIPKISKLIPPMKEIINEILEDLRIPVQVQVARNSPANTEVQVKLQGYVNSDDMEMGMDELFVDFLKPKLKSPTDDPLFSHLENLHSIPMLKISQITTTKILSYLAPIYSLLDSQLTDLFSKFNVTDSIQLLQRILFGSRGDFLIEVLELTGRLRSRRAKVPLQESEFVHEELNLEFQHLLAKYFPDSASASSQDQQLFTIDYSLDETKELRFGLQISTKFPLNLILSDSTISKYSSISIQIFRLAKCWLNLKGLKMEDCGGSDRPRIMLLKYWTLQFVASVRSFITLEIQSVGSISHDPEAQVAHLWTILSHPILEKIVIRSLCRASTCFRATWTTGISWNQLSKIETMIVGIVDGVGQEGKAQMHQFSFMHRLANYFPSDVSIILESQSQSGSSGAQFSSDTLLRTLSETLCGASKSATSLSQLLS